jgi:hypothetical protein
MKRELVRLFGHGALPIGADPENRRKAAPRLPPFSQNPMSPFAWAGNRQ